MDLETYLIKNNLKISNNFKNEAKSYALNEVGYYDADLEIVYREYNDGRYFSTLKNICEEKIDELIELLEAFREDDDVSVSVEWSGSSPETCYINFNGETYRISAHSRMGATATIDMSLNVCEIFNIIKKDKG